MPKADVLAANAAFYRAMRAGDLAAMDGLWARDRSVSCTHPEAPALVGRAEVMESWRLILIEGEAPDIECHDAYAIVTGATAMVLCREVLGEMELIASNAFVREDGEWRLVNHQAGWRATAAP